MASTQKKAAREGRTIVWVDETGFYLLAGCVRTYAPRGQTPLLVVPLTRDHLAVIGGVTCAGRLLIHIQDPSYKGPDGVHCLRHLLTFGDRALAAETRGDLGLHQARGLLVLYGLINNDASHGTK
ncbi:MAG TPA: transposase [Chloroflexia bacterium]|nr:transposase [Chloroflexia bacterium]